MILQLLWSTLVKFISKYIAFVAVSIIAFVLVKNVFKELKDAIKTFDKPVIQQKTSSPVKKYNYVYFPNIKLTNGSTRIKGDVSSVCGLQDNCYGFDMSGLLFTEKDINKSNIIADHHTGFYVKANTEEGKKLSEEICDAMKSEFSYKTGQCKYTDLPILGSRVNVAAELKLNPVFENNVKNINLSSLVEKNMNTTSVA